MDKLIDSHIPLDFWFDFFLDVFAVVVVFWFFFFAFLFVCFSLHTNLGSAQPPSHSLSCLCAQGAVDVAAPLSGTDGSLAVAGRQAFALQSPSLGLSVSARPA